MQIVLATADDDLVRAWEKTCGNIENVKIHRCSIFEVKCDAIVSPTNSFGFMDGGLDLEISEYFGSHVQKRLQKLIQTRHCGELLVGSAEVVDTDHDRVPYLIAAPIMRVPTILTETVNVYLATRAVLNLVKFGTLADGTPVKHIIETIAIPDMGTATGKVPPHICANQMKVALEEILLSQYKFPESWLYAQKNHKLLYTIDAGDWPLKI
ncbi:macro domain-containing protein [Microcoleus sp. LEGE 07076]|uniref:macro domain-containing protein n=1 Tax=Microcoleus sp. LEGE 07076 TaxID=915322 RepID=UPI00187E17D0|nr:macro domain-containing protein [Microcoleus sp. LEGE 07076]MBE9183511.1 macro domain-containing protein [Microcoleus sp. LEGE 07076]